LGRKDKGGNCSQGEVRGMQERQKHTRPTSTKEGAKKGLGKGDLEMEEGRRKQGGKELFSTKRLRSIEGVIYRPVNISSIIPGASM